MGGGMPIGAFVAGRELMQTLSFAPILGHITTFGGHPVCCAAGLATLKELLAQPYIQQVKAKAERFKRNLKHQLIRDIRNAGLLMAVELDNFELVKAVIDQCLENGLITDWFLFNDRCLRIAPPLIISEEEIDQACAIIIAAIDLVAVNQNIN